MLVFIVAPPIISEPTSGRKYLVVYNSTVTITCTASGYPPPDITIALGDTDENLSTSQDPIVLDNGLQRVEATLTFTADGGNQDGLYYCLATNEAGSDDVSFSVDIIRK